jgi:hypothetical protein
MLDREFDKTVESIDNKQFLMNKSFCYKEKAEYAEQIVELVEYLEVLYNLAIEIVEG